MRNRIVILLLVVISLWLLTCEKEGPESRPYPQAKTLSVNAITSEGACFNGEIVNPAGYEITDHGFVFSTSSDPTYDYSTRIAMGATSAEGSFSAVNSSNLRTNVEYYVKAWVKTTDKVILGLPVKFISLGSKAPVVNDFFPKKASWGDTITFTGINFGNSLIESIVYFGTVVSRVLTINDTLIETLVPQSLSDDSCLVAVEIMGNRWTGKDYFYIDSPVKMTEPDSIESTWNDTIIIHGNFPNNFIYSVDIDNIKVGLIDKSTGYLKIRIPEELFNYDGCTLSIHFNGLKLQFEKFLFLKKPVVTGFPLESGLGDTIAITGLFHPAMLHNKVLTDQIEAKIIKSTGSRLEAVIPLTVTQSPFSLNIVSGAYTALEKGIINIAKPYLEELLPGIIIPRGTGIFIGSNLYSVKTKIFVNETECTIREKGSRFIKVAFPSSLMPGPASVRVSVLNNSYSWNEHPQVIVPEIVDFSPTAGTFGDSITIKIKNISTGYLETVYFVCNGDQYPASFRVESQDQIKAAVPLQLSTNKPVLRLVFGDYYKIDAVQPFTLNDPVISDYGPVIINRKDLYTIKGSNFNPAPNLNVIFFNGSITSNYVGATRSSPDQLEFIFPDFCCVDDYTGKITTGCFSFDLPNHIEMIEPWERSSVVFPESSAAGYGAPGWFILDDRLYIVGGNKNSYTEYTNGCIYYDLNKGEWSGVKSFPGQPRSNGVSFAVNNEGFFGLGSNGHDYYGDMYVYQSASNSWQKIADFPGGARKDAFSFVLNGNAYIGAGIGSSEFKDVWQYNPVLDQWVRLHDFPGTNLSVVEAVIIDNQAYVLSDNEMWLYNPENDSWMQQSPFPGQKRFGKIMYALNGYIYAGAGNITGSIGYETILTDFWRYDPSGNSWNQVTDILYYNFTDGIGFEYQGKGYVGFGVCWACTEILMEYDPAKEIFTE